MPLVSRKMHHSSLIKVFMVAITTTAFVARVFVFAVVVVVFLNGRYCYASCGAAVSATTAMSVSTTTPTGIATTTKTRAFSASSLSPHILCVGLAAVDFVATCNHFPQPDEKMRSTALQIQGGGNAANTACAIARLLSTHSQSDNNKSNHSSSNRSTTGSSLVTAVGDDANGDLILQELRDCFHVNVNHVERYPGNSPFSYILSAPVTVRDKNSRNNDNDKTENTRTIIHQPSSGDMSMEFVQSLSPLDHQTYTAVHFDVRYPTAAAVLGKRCVVANIPYSVDVERPRPGLLELLQQASVVICASTYCRQIVAASRNHNNQMNDPDNDNGSQGSAEQLLRQVMQEQAPKAVLAIQTMGGKGSFLIRLGQQEHANDKAPMKDGVVCLHNNKDRSKKHNNASNHPVVTVKDNVMYCPTFVGCNVVDTTGAGDAFQGGFLAALWAFASWRRYHNDDPDDDKRDPNSPLVPVEVPTDPTVLAHCLRVGTRVAARKIEHAGARSGLPSMADDEFIQAEMEALLHIAKSGTPEYCT